jgi:hypothetical protein
MGGKKSGAGTAVACEERGEATGGADYFADESDTGPWRSQKSRDRQPSAGQATLAHASNEAVDLSVTADGTFQVSLAGASAAGLMAAGSPLLPDASFGIPRGVYIRIRDKQGNLVALPSCDPENWYTPLLFSSKLTVPGEEPLVPARGSSGRVSLNRMLARWSGGSVKPPPLDDLEFKLLVRLDPFLLNGDGSPADGAVPPLETEWLSGSLLR